MPTVPNPSQHQTNHKPNRQGAGQNLYTAIVRWYQNDEQLGPVIVRPAFYALDLFQRAVRAGSRMLPASITSSPSSSSAQQELPYGALKVWPLWGDAEKELRVVVINKRADEAMDVTLRIPKAGGYGDSKITRLVAQGDAPLEAKSGISVGGITYGMGGKLQGSPVTEAAARVAVDGGKKSAWKIYMPAGSAALVVIKRS